MTSRKAAVLLQYLPDKRYCVLQIHTHARPAVLMDLLAPTTLAPVLSVLILGGSVTGGGGVGNRMELAWHNSLANVRVTVHHKNAIGPEYFLHCTERFVSRSYDVVLFDLGANMFGPRAAPNLAAVIHRIRCLSQATSVGLVNWPGPIRTNATRSAAALSHADVIEVASHTRATCTPMLLTPTPAGTL